MGYQKPWGPSAVPVGSKNALWINNTPHGLSATPRTISSPTDSHQSETYQQLSSHIAAINN